MDNAEKTCCFTGHRPKKLHTDEEMIRKELKAKIAEAIEAGYSTFISGMAFGVDLWAAEIVLDLKKDRQDLHLICAFPFQKKNYTAEEIRVMNAADLVEHVSEQYLPTGYHLRNQWMVDRSSRVIAVFNGSPGGTERTIEYAKQKGKEIVLIECK